MGVSTRTAFVYVIGETCNGPIKLGATDNPPKRLGELQVANPRELFLYHSLQHPAAIDVEAWAQRRLRDRHIRGEWYDVNPAEAANLLAEAVTLHAQGKLTCIVRARNLRETDSGLERFCSRCRQWLSVEMFARSKARKIGLQARCKECAQAYQREYQARPGTRERHNESERRRKQRLREAKLASGGGVCTSTTEAG